MSIGKAGVWTSVVYVLLFAVSTVLMVFLANFPGDKFSMMLKPMGGTIYAWHLACWMVLGMTANFLWDHLNAGKALADVKIGNLLVPLLVSPIVFFGLWSLVPKAEITDLSKVSLTWSFVAFQNGFFWQVVFSKAAPVLR